MAHLDLCIFALKHTLCINKIRHMEEQINEILKDKKDALLTEVEIENNNSEQLRALLLAKIEKRIPKRAIGKEMAIPI